MIWLCLILNYMKRIEIILNIFKFLTLPVYSQLLKKTRDLACLCFLTPFIPVSVTSICQLNYHFKLSGYITFTLSYLKVILKNIFLDSRLNSQSSSPTIF